jgi:HEPN domain-containing protein
MKKATQARLEFAHRDLVAARLLSGNEYVSNAVLFHSQQCVEKCLRALLEECRVPVPHVHSVDKLCALIEEEGTSIPLDEKELDPVDAVYILRSKDIRLWNIWPGISMGCMADLRPCHRISGTRLIFADQRSRYLWVKP